MPERTSVYRLYDSANTLLYVGVGGDVGMRFTQHRIKQPWWDDVCSIRLVHFHTRDEALVAEREAIETECPLHNIVHSTTRPFISAIGGSGVARAKDWDRVVKLSAELDRAVRNALRSGFKRDEVARATGYTRERLRQLAQPRKAAAKRTR